jgi:hypothetical protein
LTSIDQVLADIQTAKRRFAGRRERQMDVLAIREGRWEEVAPGFFPEDIPEPMIANFIDVAARATAESIAPLPSFSCSNPSMSTDSARKSADKRTKIANHYVAHSRLGETNQDFADNVNSYGFGAYIVEPDFESKTPCVYVGDTLNALYGLNRKGETVWYAECYLRSVDELMWEYEEYAEQFRSLKDMRQSDVELVRYYGHDEDMVLIPQLKLTLHRIKNPLSRCRVRVVERPKTGQKTRGAYDDVIWIQLARARFGVLTMKIADDVANAPTAVPNDVQDFEVGPNAVLRSDNPQAIRRVDLSVPAQPFMELQSLGDELRLGSRHSEARDGQIDASIITGKGVEALLAGNDGYAKSIQGRIASALTDVLAMCFELDEKLWGNSEKSVRGLQDGAPFELKYKPSRDINGDYTCSVSYGLTAGLDPNRSLVFLLQALTSGVISRDTVQRQMPFDLDVTAEQKRIYVEQHRDALMASVSALAQAIPAMAMQGGDPTEIVTKLSAVVQALQKGDAIEDAVAKAFPPAPPPPQAPAQDPMAAAGGAAPQGPEAQLAAMAGGGAPAGGGGPAEQLMMALAGTGPTGDPNLSLTTSTRRPV